MITRQLLLILTVSLGLIACDPAGDKSETANDLMPDKITLHDSIFNQLKECLSKSTSSEILWNVSQPWITDDESAEQSQPFKILGLTKDPKEILHVVDSFPKIKSKADTIEVIKASTDFHLYFMCNSDTLLKCSWDPGKHQIYINGSPYKIDFDKLYEILDRLPNKK